MNKVKMEFNQSSIQQQCTFVGEEHAYFESMVADQANRVSADKIVLSCTGLVVLQSSTGGKFVRESNVDDSTYMGTIGNTPVYLNTNLGEHDVAAEISGPFETVNIMIDTKNLRFI